jgi:hypothetical protein
MTRTVWVLAVVALVTMVVCVAIIANVLKPDVKYRYNFQHGLGQNPTLDAKIGDRNVHICRRSKIHVTATTEFALVSLLSYSANSAPRVNSGYTEAAAKLGTSFRQFSTMDMLMLAVDIGPSAPTMIHDAGWMWCDVPLINAPSGVHNRFIDAGLYSKLWAWKLTEYAAVFFVDSDCVILSDFSHIFTQHLPEMKTQGAEIGMVIDSPQYPTNNCLFWNLQSASSFNAGVMLMIPSNSTSSSVISAINTLPHNTAFAEQGLMVSYFQSTVYKLPWFFNYNLVSHYCEPGLHNLDRIIVVHFTVSKPWNTQDCSTWQTQYYCELWKLLPTKLPLLIDDNVYSTY